MSFEKTRRVHGIVWGLGMLLFVFGCRERRRPRVSLTEKALPRVCRVAVLPFRNQTKTAAAGLMLYRIVMAEMTRSGNFTVIEEGMIRRVLLRGKIFPGRPITPEVRDMINKTAHPDALLSGEVVEAVETVEEVLLAFRMRMRDARTGRLLWTTYYARRGEDYRTVMHFGEIGSLTGLARRMILDVLGQWREKGWGGCGK